MKDLKAYSTFAEMQDIVASYGKQFEVAAVIYGKKHRLNEYQVRDNGGNCGFYNRTSDMAFEMF